MDRARAREPAETSPPDGDSASPVTRLFNSDTAATARARSAGHTRATAQPDWLLLRTLGRLALENGGRPIIGAAAQPGRLAILSVIAACGEAGVSRDRLLLLFWPESDTEHARGALKQALYALRRDAGEQDLILGTTTLRLNPEAIRSDVCEFERSVEAGELEPAVKLYAGPFLDGVHVDAAAEFDLWVEVQRDRLSRRYAQVVETLARQAARRGDHAAAAEWWQRLAVLDPLSARVTLGLMQALVAAGDRAGALHRASRHEAALRSELNLPPDPAVAALVATLRNPAPPERLQAPATAPADDVTPPAPPFPRARQAAAELPGEVSSAAATGPATGEATSPAASPATVGRGPHTPPSRAARRRWGVAALAAGSAVLALFAVAEISGRSPPMAGRRRSVLALPLAEPVVDAPGLTFALSPDAATVVYVGRSAAGQQLLVRRMDAMQSTLIRGTEGASTPFFSPDGEWVGFVAGGKIRKVPMHGGAVETVCDAPGVVLGASWADDGIVFAPSASSGLMRVAATGGPPVLLTAPDTAHGETSHRWPQVLPGGTEVLFTSWSGDFTSAQAAVLDLRTGLIRRLGAGIGARYSTTGHIVFATADGRLLAAPFDSRTLEVSHKAREVLRGVRLDGGPAFAVGAGGMLVYMPSETAQRTVEWIDRQGRSTAVISSPGVYSDPRLSPDGSRLALTIRRDGAADVWVYAFATGTLSRLTRGAESLYPVWAPDGRSITFASTRRGALDLYQVSADGAGEPTLLWVGPGDDVPDSWSPDGQTLFFRSTDPVTARDIWTLSTHGSRRRAEPVIETEADERSAMISPDGRWLAYTSDRSGVTQVYVQAYPRARGSWQVSPAAGAEPLWSRDGGELFYRAGDAVIAAAIDTRGGFHVVARAELFASQLMANAFRTNYDVASDGRRFISIRNAAATTQLVVLMNWLSSANR